MNLCAIVLCAGVGSRLRPHTDALPKCLVPVLGRSMLERCLASLAEAGASRAIVVTGYRASQVELAVKSAPLPVQCVHEPRYASTQNVVSFAAGLAAVREGEGVVKLDGDVLFRPEIVRSLLSLPAAVAVEMRDDLGDEEMKVVLEGAGRERVEGGRVLRFGKGLDRKSAAAESIGIEAFDAESAWEIAAAMARAVRDGRTQLYYEDVYNDVVDRVRFTAVNVDASQWIEVDDDDDLRRAAETVACWEKP